MHQPELRLVPVGVVLQIEIHRKHHQRAIFGLPWRRIDLQQQVFERLVAQRCQAGIHTLGIGLNHRPIIIATGLQHAAGAIAKTMDAHLSIGLQHFRADQFRQLAGRIAPQEIHLKETVLGMNQSGGKRQVEAIARANRGNSQAVALDDDLSRDPRRRDLAIEFWQTCDNLAANPEAKT